MPVNILLSKIHDEPPMTADKNKPFLSAFIAGSYEKLLVGLGRIELPTSPLSGVRSSHLSYRPMLATHRSAAAFFRPANRALIAMVELVGIEPATS